MTNGDAVKSIATNIDSHKANKDLIEYLQATLVSGAKEIRRLRQKLSITYWVIVIMSVTAFVLGVALLSIPLFATFGDFSIDIYQSSVAGGFGMVDLIALFLFRPIDRIQKLMGDMSQITLAIGSFRKQVALRLLELDHTDRATIGYAAEKIHQAAQETIRTIQEHFENMSKLKLYS